MFNKETPSPVNDVNGDAEQTHSRRAVISFIWTRVTAADFDSQQSPYATPLLSPALLPIGGVRHKLLTRSMRFLHTPPTGNHSREVRMRRGESGESSKPTFLWLRSCKEEVREEREAASLTWNERCLQRLPLRGCWRDLLRMQAFPSRTFIVAKHDNRSLEVGDTLDSYFYMHEK